MILMNHSINNMATIIRKGFGFEVPTSVLFVVILFASGFGDRVNQKIYIDLDTQSSCFRILNGTHEVGCTSAEKGNVGTVHYIQDDSDFSWILSKGPHDPYVAVLDGADFTGTNVRRLYKSSRVNGILVINTRNEINPDMPVDGFSSQDKCPNDQSGLYGQSDEYKSCRKGDWNPAGSSLGLENINIPIFALSTQSDVDNVLQKCFYPFNHPVKGRSTGYPVCAAEVKARMDAAVNGVSCTRRSNIFSFGLSPTSNFCDPLGDKNVMATMMENKGTVERKENSVIIVAAKLDATSLFYNEYYAADTVVTGLVTLLASAEALWKVKDTIRQEPNAKDIMYTFFQGETFDYIGSSRMVYDMTKNNFPSGSSSKTLPKLKLPHIHQIVEMNQVGRRDDGGSLWAHMDPLGQSQVGDQVQQMISELQSFGKAMGVSIDKPKSDLPLPPASSQSFLKHRLDIPTVVITDHEKEFTNKFYNSRFDSAALINAADYPAKSDATVKYNYITKQAELIANLSTTLAHYLYNASTGKEPDEATMKNLTADSSTVTHMLYCFLVSPNCELFLESVDKTNAKSLKTTKSPFPFYVSVVNTHINVVTQLVYSLLARFTGDRLDLKKGDCNAPKGEKHLSYTWMQGAKDGDKGHRDGWCIRSTAFYSLAKSPAFDIDGYDMSSHEYSTWVESVWGGQAIGVRLFLIPSSELQIRLLVTGIVMLVLSLAIVYFLSSRAHILFRPHGCLDSLTYNQMS